MENQIILASGKLIPLAEYQTSKRLNPDKISKYISLDEIKRKCPDGFMLSELLLQFFDALRATLNTPKVINSAYRTEEKQAELTKEGYRTAKTSPHCQGMAFDIDTWSNDQTNYEVGIAKKVAKDLKLKVRIGYKEYMEIGQTFYHVDVCPEYYAKGKPYANNPHPSQWERESEW